MHRKFEQDKAAAKKQKKSAPTKRKWTDDTAVTNSSPEKIGPPESKQIKMDEFVLPKPLSKIEQQKIDGLVMEYCDRSSATLHGHKVIISKTYYWPK